MLRLRGSSEGPSFSRTPKTRHLADAHMHTHCALPMHGPAPVPGIIARCCCALAASWAGYNWEQGVRCPVKLLRLVRPWTSTAYEGLGSSGWALFFHSRRAIFIIELPARAVHRPPRAARAQGDPGGAGVGGLGEITTPIGSCWAGSPSVPAGGMDRPRHQLPAWATNPPGTKGPA